MNVLAVGAHPDDIEIGCAGSLAFHHDRGDEILMVTLTAGENGGETTDGLGEVRIREAYKAASLLGAGFACLGFPDTEVAVSKQAISALETLVFDMQPDRAYVPYHNDTHQDHRATAQIAMSACRDVKQVLMYEGPTNFTDFSANHWIDVTEFMADKRSALKAHESQGHKEMLKLQAIEGLNAYRGYQVLVGYAEGFITHRFVENV